MATCLVVGSSFTAQPASSRGPARIGLFGDSLSVQAAPYFNFLIQAGGRATVKDFIYGGTAACDWLPAMRQFARSEHPQAAVLEFVGNTFSPCMLGCAAGSRTAVHLYCSALSQAIQAFLGAGTHVFLIGTPITLGEWSSHDPTWDALNDALAGFAKQHPQRITYVNAGRAVEGPHDSYVSTLPCLVFEPCTGPITNGVRTDVVRSPDGVHFCPQQVAKARGQVSACAVYSSGAFRFAAAMAGPVIRSLHLGAKDRPADDTSEGSTRTAGDWLRFSQLPAATPPPTRTGR